jgi:hypothetical protein
MFLQLIISQTNDACNLGHANAEQTTQHHSFSIALSCFISSYSALAYSKLFLAADACRWLPALINTRSVSPNMTKGKRSINSSLLNTLGVNKNAIRYRLLTEMVCLHVHPPRGACRQNLRLHRKGTHSHSKQLIWRSDLVGDQVAATL